MVVYGIYSVPVMYLKSNLESKPFSFYKQDLVAGVLNNLSDILMLLDSNFRFIYVNAKGEQFLRRQQNEIFQKCIWEVCPFEKNSKLFNVLLKASSGKCSVSEDFFSLTHFNCYKVTAYPSPDGLVVLIGDAREGGVHDQRLNYERELADILNSIPQIIWISSPQGDIINLNKRWTEYTGLSIADGLGYNWLNVIHPDDIEQLKEGWEKSISSKTGLEHEYRIKGADGVYRWHLDRNKPVCDDQHNILYWIGTSTEIHKQKLAQEELKESHYFIQKITEASPSIICVYDYLKQRHIYINDAIHSYFGVPRKDFLEMNIHEVLNFVHPEDRDIYLSVGKMFNNALDNEIKEIEYRAKSSKGNWMWMKTRSRVFKRDNENKVIEITSITEDITKQKEAEVQQLQNAIIQLELEEKEEFLNIASHELKAPVTNVKASVQILKRLIEKDTDKDTLLVFINKANRQIIKLTELIKHLLESAKLQSGKLHLNKCTFLIEEVISDAVSHIIDKHRISIQNSVQDNIKADKRKIEQVVLNYLTNALKYSPKGKEIILAARKEGNSIRVSVTDFGIGVPKEQLAHVFDRFYRVNPASVEYSGLGLGLYICSEIIKHHNGEYGVESEEGKGSTFWFSIPREE